EYGQPGSNGLTLDPQGRLTINEHGNRRVTRVEKDGRLTVLADNYEGKRLNSPNDLIYRSDGALFFTDPPFGLPKFYDDPRKQLPFSGVLRFTKASSSSSAPISRAPTASPSRPIKNIYTSATGIRKKRSSCAMRSIPTLLCPMEKSSST